MKINKNNDILIFYNYLKDNREYKNKFPDFLKTKEDILIVYWSKNKLEKNINNKFNSNGFIIFNKSKNGDCFSSICFGKPFTYNDFINGIKNNKIYFDSGMYNGNSRNYSQFRAKNDFWLDLLEEEY